MRRSVVGSAAFLFGLLALASTADAFSPVAIPARTNRLAPPKAACRTLGRLVNGPKVLWMLGTGVATGDAERLPMAEPARVSFLRQMRAMSMRATLWIILTFGALGAIRPGTAAAVDGGKLASHEQAAQLRFEDGPRHYTRLAFSCPGQDAAPSAANSATRPAFVTSRGQWKGIFAELRVGEKLGNIYSEWAEWMTFKFYGLLTSSGMVKLFMFTSFTAALVGAGAWAFRAADNEEYGWGESLFKAYALLNNVAGASAVNN